jgi:hypothetical protein
MNFIFGTRNVRNSAQNWSTYIFALPIKTVQVRLMENSTRSIGKPRTRWEDVVQMVALQVLGIRRGDELGIEMNGGVIRGRPGPRRGCSATYGWN